MAVRSKTRSWITGRRRAVLVAAMLLTSSTGAVMASNVACREIVLRGYSVMPEGVKRRVHHSAATLARWKVGAEAWSRQHNGRVYPGAPVKAHRDWAPLRFSCEAVALDVSRPDEGLTIAGETLPPLPVDLARIGAGAGDPVTLSGASAAAEASQATMYAGVVAPVVAGVGGGRSGGIGGGGLSGGAGGLSGAAGGLGGGGNAPNGPVTGATVPTVLPVPEPSGLILMGTGMAMLCARRARAWLSRSR